MSDDGQVVPFDRARRTRPGPAPDHSVHPATRAARPQARDLAAQQNEDQREQHALAAAEQRAERLLVTGTPVPARITLALGDWDGPEVDLAVGTWEGNPAGDVDAWEDPDDPRQPNADQVRLLSEKTGYPIPWFYEPYTPRPVRGMICWADKRGCEPFEYDGVVVPPGKQPGQHTLPSMPAPDPPPAKRQPVEPRTAPRRPPPERSQQMTLPVGRLPDDERALLMERIAEAKRKRR